MDPYSGQVGTHAEIKEHMLRSGRNPAEMVEISGPPESIERVSRAVAAHRPNRKARRKAQRAARRRNR
jgi:hypothetical protein